MILSLLFAASVAMTPADSLTAVQADTLTLAMCGDIMMGTTYPTVRLPENNGATIFEDPKEVLVSATLTLGTLEGAISDGGKCTKKDGPHSYAFRTPTSYAHLLTEAGFDYMCMANNHSNDFGPEGLSDGEKALDKEGIAYSGVAGRREWAVVEREGVRFGVCAFGHNSYTLKHSDLKKVASILDTLGKTSDVVVVAFHGGAEGSDKGHLPRGPETYLGENRGDLRKFAHFCIEHGADVVFGSGPHVTRCVEVYKGRFIAYSLGNFCTPYGMNLSGTCGYAPVVTVRILPDGSFLDGQIHPFIQQYGQGPKKDKKGIVTAHMKALTDKDVPESEAEVLPDGAIRLKK